MSEKIQGTAASLREKMLLRYDDEYYHKHNKNHLSYRGHCKSHPSKQAANNKEKWNLDGLGSTGLLREFKLKKVRLRFDKGRFH